MDAVALGVLGPVRMVAALGEMEELVVADPLGGTGRQVPKI